MKVCLLTPKFPPDEGGVARACHRLSNQLSATVDFTVLVLTRERLPFSPSRFPVVHMDTLNNQQLFEWIVAHAPWDLIHAYYPSLTGFPAVFSAHYLKIPVLLSCRGNDIDRDIWQENKLTALLWSLQQAHAITTVTSDLKRKVLSLCEREQVHYIPNSVDSDFFKPCETTLDFGIDRSRPVLGFVGEARQKKGLPILLTAFLEICKQRPDCQLLLVGGIRPGRAQEIFDVFIKQNPELANHIVIIPYQPPEKLPALYALLDIVLFPSYQDGMANACLEAMACKKCVVATTVGGFPEMIQDGHNGYLIPPYQSQPLSDRVLELLEKPLIREQVGKKARKTMLEHFTMKQETDRFGELYQWLTGCGF